MRRGRCLLPLLLIAGCGEDSGRVVATSEGARQEPFVAVPVGSVPVGAHQWEAALEPPGPPVTPALLRTGAGVYRDVCAPCHGPTGAGDGPVVQRGFPRSPPLSRRAPAPAETVGIVTVGQGEMPALARQVRPVERWAVAHYLARRIADGE